MEEEVQEDVDDVTQEPILGNEYVNQDVLDNQSDMFGILSPT